MAVWNFVYGSHLSPERFAQVLGGRPLEARRAWLGDHALAFYALTQ